jgi:hypothetical protein
MLVGLILVAFTLQAPRTLRPLDEAKNRPDFVEFRTRLQSAISRHDANAVLQVVRPDIKNSFGGDNGVELFKKQWRLNDPDSKFWSVMASVLALGGSFTEANTFTAPYVFSRWPDDLDAFDYVAVIGSNVRVRTEARSDAPVLTTVSYSILRLDDEAIQSGWSEKEWAAVRVNGRKAYIARRFVRSPIDYRATFKYTGGRWWLAVFVAGD